MKHNKNINKQQRTKADVSKAIQHFKKKITF